MSFRLVKGTQGRDGGRDLSISIERGIRLRMQSCGAVSSGEPGRAFACCSQYFSWNHGYHFEACSEVEDGTCASCASIGTQDVSLHERYRRADVTQSCTQTLTK